MQITSSENKVLVQWLVAELFNHKRMEVTKFLYAPDCRGTTPDGAFANRNEFLAGFARYAAAFPDSRTEVDYLMSEGDRVVVHYTFTGTHTGSWAGLPPTGRTVRIGGMMISRIADGRIVEQDFVWDVAAARQQLVAKPTPTFRRAA